MYGYQQGQQKLLVYALKLAQAYHLKHYTEKQSILLIDDLPAELDLQKRALIEPVLTALGQQVFITSISSKDLSSFSKHTSTKMFHVEQGKIIAHA